MRHGAFACSNITQEAWNTTRGRVRSERKSADILRVHFLWVQPGIFVVSETSSCFLLLFNHGPDCWELQIIFFSFFEGSWRFKTNVKSLTRSFSCCRLDKQFLKTSVMHLYSEPVDSSLFYIFYGHHYWVWLPAKNNAEKPHFYAKWKDCDLSYFLSFAADQHHRHGMFRFTLTVWVCCLYI